MNFMSDSYMLNTPGGPAWAAGVGGGGFPGAPKMLGMNVNIKCIEMKHDCFSVADLGRRDYIICWTPPPPAFRLRKPGSATQ